MGLNLGTNALPHNAVCIEETTNKPNNRRIYLFSFTYLIHKVELCLQCRRFASISMNALLASFRERGTQREREAEEKTRARGRREKKKITQWGYGFLRQAFSSFYLDPHFRIMCAQFRNLWELTGQKFNKMHVSQFKACVWFSLLRQFQPGFIHWIVINKFISFRFC